MMTLDLRSEGTTFGVPMFLFEGEQDVLDPTSLAVAWFDSVKMSTGLDKLLPTQMQVDAEYAAARAKELATTAAHNAAVAAHAASIPDIVVNHVNPLGVVNLFVALFNFVPLLPLDGGHIAGALYEAVRRAWARMRRKPDPGYADVAKMLPIAYVAASVILVMGVLLIYADIVNPIKLS